MSEWQWKNEIKKRDSYAENEYPEGILEQAP